MKLATRILRRLLIGLWIAAVIYIFGTLIGLFLIWWWLVAPQS